MLTPKQLTAIRDRIKIADVISPHVKLTPKGRSLVGACPFCKAEAFNVNTERGFFYCFGCKENGTAFDFVMKAEGLSFRDTAMKLASTAGVEPEEPASKAASFRGLREKVARLFAGGKKGD